MTSITKFTGLLAFFFLLTTFPAFISASDCEVESSIERFGNLSYPIRRVADTFNNETVLELKGFIKIDNGCSFTATNFTLLNAPNEVYWFGRKGKFEENTEGVKISNNAITPIKNGQISFELMKGTWDDYQTLVLFSKEKQFVLGYVDLSAKDDNGDGKADSNGAGAGAVPSSIVAGVIVLVALAMF